MKVIGLTGGIGSGKSTVARVFRVFGVPVFEADKAGREAYSDPAIREAVIRLLGPDVYNGAEVNRALVAKRVFEQPPLLSSLNQLIHPYVARRWKSWLASCSADYVIRESAILLESGAAADCDAIVVVTAPEDLRIRRVMHRDGLTPEEIRLRMKRQMPEAERVKHAGTVIVNDEKHLLTPELLRLDTLFRKS